MKSWGRFVHRRRGWVLAASLLLFAVTLGALLQGGDLKNSDQFSFESGQGFTLMSDQLPKSAGTSISFVVSSPSQLYTDPAFKDAVGTTFARLRSDAQVAAVHTPYDPGANLAAVVSRDQHAVVIEAILNVDFATARQDYQHYRDEIQPGPLQITAAGDVVLAYDYDYYSERDLRNSDGISGILALLLLFVIFGTVVAALLPLGSGGMAVVGGLGGTYLLAHAINVSTYATSVVSLIGLGLAIDYSLFIVSRFREELARGKDVETALATTMATAGRAIAFSGITVAVGLVAMLFYSGTFLVSMGLSGAMVVAASLIYALSFLPALLSLLGTRVNRLRIPVMQPKPFGEGAWHRIATWVMQRPWMVIIPTLAVLVLLASPVASMKLANSDVGQLPPNAEARVGNDLLHQNFVAAGTNVINVVLDFPSGAPTAPQNVATAYTASRQVATLPGVSSVESYVDVNPSLTLPDYQKAYANPHALPVPQAALLTTTTGTNIAVINITTPYDESSDQASTLVQKIRDRLRPTTGATVLVTGSTAFNVDYVQFMIDHTPGAVAFVMITTFFILLILLRSIVLPIKAVIMNLLSLSAAFGVMVWVFQQGHLSGFLNFSPAPIDPTLPVLVFCIVFGLSMDYEVFLLTRMQEAYRRTGDNRLAVAEGLERSGRLVTGAAAIMICVFGVFAFASLVVIKATGLSMGVAVLVDATLVRALVVPALMRLLGSANWWAPRWLQRLPGEPEDDQRPAAA